MFGPPTLLIYKKDLKKTNPLVVKGVKYYLCYMKKIRYELYNPSLSLRENAEILGCSIPAIKKHFKTKEIDRRYDACYNRWKQIQDLF
jgi:hypothetical protein